MTVKAKTFLEDLHQFTAESTRWCAQASEQESARILSTLNAVVADMQRRSKMSAKALAAVSELQKGLSSDARLQIKPLQQALTALRQTDAEVHAVVSPVVQALQFQDLLRQNLENIVKVLGTWLARRQALAAAGEGPEAALTQLGRELLGCTTTLEERNMIRTFFPGLPDETVPDDVMLF